MMHISTLGVDYFRVQFIYYASMTCQVGVFIGEISFPKSTSLHDMEAKIQSMGP